MNVLVRDGLILTQDERRSVIEGSVFVEDGLITHTGAFSDTSDIVIEASGGIVMPGLINTHTHVAMTGLRGQLDDMNLEPFLEKTFSLDSGRSPDDILDSTAVSLSEMVSSGTTSFADLYYSEDLVADVCRKMGIRGFLAWVTLDKEITTQAGDPVANAEKFIRSHSNDVLVTPMVGLQGVYACSEETIASAKETACRLGTGMHMHLCETRNEVYGHVRKTGKRPVEWLEQTGLLDGSTHLLAAHCAWLTRAEMRVLKKAGVSVSSCTRSNMKLGSGIAPVKEMVDEGITVSFGTDSATTSNNLDMFEEIRTASFLQKVNKWDASILPAQQAFDMATRNAAKSLGAFDRIGSLEAGKAGDIVVLDRSSFRLSPLSAANAVNQVVYSAQGGDVLHTIVNGKPLFVDRQFVDRK